MISQAVRKVRIQTGTKSAKIDRRYRDYHHRRGRRKTRICKEIEMGRRKNTIKRIRDRTSGDEIRRFKIGRCAMRLKFETLRLRTTGWRFGYKSPIVEPWRICIYKLGKIWSDLDGPIWRRLSSVWFFMRKWAGLTSPLTGIWYRVKYYWGNILC